MFGGDSKPIDKEPLNIDNEKEKNRTVIYSEDGTINYEYDDEKEENKE